MPLRAPLVELPGGVRAVGLSLDDHEAVVHAASGSSFAGLPEAAVLKRRAEFLAGRMAAAQALHALGITELPGRCADGRPSWPTAVVGSISHGAGRALCAVARSADFSSLGIDTERVLGADSKPELHRRICTEAERAVLGVALGLADHERVSVAFSAKESLYKCLYPLVGRYMDFHAARVMAANARSRDGVLSGELRLELTVDWSETFRAGRTLTATFALTREHVETAVALPA